MFVDAHAHLQNFPNQLNYDWDAYLKFFSIDSIVCNGTGLKDWESVHILSSSSSRIVPAYGVHPWKVMDQPDNWLDCLERYLSNDRALIGEIGLDKWVRDSDFELQKVFFMKQLELGIELKCPIVVHCLKAFGHLNKFLGRYEKIPAGFLLHSYGGPKEFVSNFLKKGAYFSFSAYFLREHKGAVREIFREIPLERILLETDAPDMKGPDFLYDKKVNSPSWIDALNPPAIISRIYEEFAKLYKLPLEDLVKQMNVNYKNFLLRA